MQITVFGANGRVGQLVVERLLADGHSVTAFIHQHSPFEPNDHLSITKSDVHDTAAVEAAVHGSDAIMSTLGSWHTPTKDILSAAMSNIIPAMQQANIKRIISLTGSAAWSPGDTISFANKLQHVVFSGLARDIIRDAETHLQLLYASDLDWTVVRSPVMRDAAHESYALDLRMPQPWDKVSRQAVAQALVDQLEDERFIKTAPHIHAVT